MLVVEDEPYMAEAIRDGLRREAIAADIAGDGDSALELLSINAYDIAVLDRDIPGPSGDEIAESIVASGSGMPILMLTAADRLDDKASGFGLGADDYLTKPFEFRELVLRLRALDRRRAHNRPPVREIAGLRLDPFRREVYRDGRYVAVTRKQFAVLEVLVAAEGGVISAEELLERAWDENADPFTNAVRITVSALRKRLGEPWIIATVAGVGYRTSCTTRSSTTSPNTAPCSSAPPKAPSPSYSPSKTPATSSPRSWSRFSPNRSSAAPDARAVTIQGSASAWPSSRASPRHTTEPSPSPPGPPGGSASPPNYPMRRPVRAALEPPRSGRTKVA